MSERSVKRKTLVAREDLTNRISEMAERRGYSFYDMVNEVFELTVKAEDAGVNLRKAVEEHEVLTTAKEAGFILCIESLWYDMAELAYKKAKSKTLKSWFNAGIWFAKRYVTGEAEDPFEAFKRDLEAFTWNAPEFNVEKTEKEVSIRIISPRFPESYTLMYEAFLEGILETFGYKTVDKQVERGGIRLKARKEAEANEQG